MVTAVCRCALPLLLQQFWYHGYVTHRKAAPQERTQQFCCNSLQIVTHFIFCPSTCILMYVLLYAVLYLESLSLVHSVLHDCEAGSTRLHAQAKLTNICRARFTQNRQILLSAANIHSYTLRWFLCLVKTIVCLQYRRSDLLSIKVDCLFTLRSQPHSIQHESSTGHTASRQVGEVWWWTTCLKVQVGPDQVSVH